MALLNRCMFRAASGGSGDFVVASAETGARTPTEAGAENGASYSYVAESDDRSQVAFGTGTWNSGTSTLVRGTEEFIGSGFAGNFSAAPRVMLTPLAADFEGGGGGAVEVIAHLDFGANPATSVSVPIDFAGYSRVEMVSNYLRVDASELAQNDAAAGLYVSIDNGAETEILSAVKITTGSLVDAIYAEAYDDGGLVVEETAIGSYVVGVSVDFGSISFLMPASVSARSFVNDALDSSDAFIGIGISPVTGGTTFEMSEDTQDVVLHFFPLKNGTDPISMNAGTLTFYGYKIA